MKTYLDTARTPGIVGNLTAGFTVLCGVVFNTGLSRTLLDDERYSQPWMLIVLWILPFAGAWGMSAWVGRKPVTAFSADARIWGIGLLGLAGMVLIAVADRRDFAPVTFLVGAGALMAWVYLRHARQREGALEAAERHQWRLSEGEAKDLSWEVVLEREMDPARRRRHTLALVAIFGMFWLCVGDLVMTLIMAGDHIDPTAYGLAAACYFGSIAAFIAMYLYLSRLMRREMVERKVGAMELATARTMQMGLLPKGAPSIEGLDVAGSSVPATEVGGDLFDYYAPGGSPAALGVVVADVSGKAMQAAVAAVMMNGALRAEYPRSGSPAEMLTNLDRALRGGLGRNAFIAAQVITFDAKARTAVYANAGQQQPLLLRNGAVSALQGGGLPLGVPDGDAYGDQRLTLEPGDLLALFTDGMTEAMNGRRELYGYGRLESALAALPASCTAGQAMEALLKDVRVFVGPAPQHDDLTLVVVRITP